MIRSLSCVLWRHHSIRFVRLLSLRCADWTDTHPMSSQWLLTRILDKVDILVWFCPFKCYKTQCGRRVVWRPRYIFRVQLHLTHSWANDPFKSILLWQWARKDMFAVYALSSELFFKCASHLHMCYCRRTVYTITKIGLHVDGVCGHPRTLLMTKITSQNAE